MVLGILIALIAYLAGPGKGAGWVRRQTVRGSRATVDGTRHLAESAEAPIWVRDHLDHLRIGGLVLAAILAIVLSSWISLLIIVLVLAAYEIAVTLIAGRAPQPPTGPGVPPSAPAKEPSHQT